MRIVRLVILSSLKFIAKPIAAILDLGLCATVLTALAICQFAQVVEG
jgi:hypothetical protein